jgi:trimethylamine---corrinoid protein Co-methyltransferase
MDGITFSYAWRGWKKGSCKPRLRKWRLTPTLLAMVTEFLRPLSVDEAEPALEAICEVGPGGQFFRAEYNPVAPSDRFLPAKHLRLAQQ